MINKIIISLGISLVVGVLSGYYLSEEKYFFLDPQGPKREVTKETSENDPYIKEGTSIEKVFNTTQAIVIGLGTFGGLLIFSTFLKTKKNH